MTVINHVDAMLRIHDERMERLRAEATRGYLLRERSEPVRLEEIGSAGGSFRHDRRNGLAVWRRLEMRPLRLDPRPL